MDLSDPAERAAARLQRLRRRDRTRRIAAAVCLVALAIAGPAVAGSVTGYDGATIGAVVLSLLLLALAAAVWPYRPYPREEEHRTLDAIWRELRADATETVAWERCAAWATSTEGSVELALVRCAGGHERVAEAPSPYRLEMARRVDAGDMAAAAQAMEELRARAVDEERAARERYEREREEAARAAHEEALREIDAASAAEIAAREEKLREELAQQDAFERQVQADAMARALRKP